MENNEEIVEDHFYKYMKEYKKHQATEYFDPTMLDYTIGDKTSLRFEYIKNIPNEQTRIDEMSKFMKENIKLEFPTEFYDWLSRDMLGLKYKKWEIDEMKRQYRIKKKRELRRQEEQRKKNKNGKRGKKPKVIENYKKTYTTEENPYILKFK